MVKSFGSFILFKHLPNDDGRFHGRFRGGGLPGNTQNIPHPLEILESCQNRPRSNHGATTGQPRDTLYFKIPDEDLMIKKV